MWPRHNHGDEHGSVTHASHDTVSAYPADHIDDEDVESGDQVNVALAVGLEEFVWPWCGVMST